MFWFLSRGYLISTSNIGKVVIWLFVADAILEKTVQWHLQIRSGCLAQLSRMLPVILLIIVVD